MSFCRDKMKNNHLLLMVHGMLVASTFMLCVHCGVTSSYKRKLAATVDMPLDSDVFKVPQGYNAPQQANIFFILSYNVLYIKYVFISSTKSRRCNILKSLKPCIICNVCKLCIIYVKDYMYIVIDVSKFMFLFCF